MTSWPTTNAPRGSIISVLWLVSVFDENGGCKLVIFDSWRDVAQFIPHSRRRLLALSTGGVVAALSEAMALVLIVNAAVKVAGTAVSKVPSSLPIDLSADQMLVVAAVLSLTVIVTHWFTNATRASISSAALMGAQQRAIAAFVGAPWEKQSTEKSGGLHEMTSPLASQVSSLSIAAAVWVLSALQLAALMIAALVVDAVATVVVVLLGAAVFAGLRPISKATKRRSRRYVMANSSFINLNAQVTSISMELKVYGVEEVAVSNLARASSAAGEAFRRARQLSQFGGALYRDVAMVLLVAAVASLQAISTEALAATGAVVILVIRAVGSAQGLFSAQQTLSELQPHVELLLARVVSLEEVKVDFGREVLESVRTVEMTSVVYRYAKETPALEGVSFSLSMGEVLGIVGPSGGGKSTLVQVLLRLRLPQSGSVRINGIAYELVDEDSWARSIGFVPQEPQLMEGTVAENIAFFRPGITLQNIEAAAEAAHIATDIRLLPHGYDTVLGPEGRGLSGGQKQRIAIARALVGEPSLLVLDEPTSALDAVSERLIRDTLANLRPRTIIVIIAHRPATIEICDRLIMLGEGRIVERGAPDKLGEKLGFMGQAFGAPD